MEALVSTAWQWWLVLWPHVLATAILAINIGASAHAILVKRDTRSTIGWVGLIWLSPVFGAIAYAVLGVNRIRSRAGQLRAGQLAVIHELRAAVPTPERLAASTGPDHAPLRSLATLVGEVTGRPLVDGNQIEPLIGGDEAYPRMLAAIDAATRSIGMASYIFDNDPTGKLFAAALDAGATEIVILGGLGSSGGRSDHALGTISLLAHPRARGVQLSLLDATSRIQLLVAPAHCSISSRPGAIVSLVPWFSCLESGR